MDPPDWFTTAIAVRPDDLTVDVGDARVHYRGWGAPDHPGLVLVHGGAAHSGWWDHIAPLLSDEYRVVALDLTGHGDSDRRAGYDLGAWAREVVAVAADAQFPGPPIVVAHSMGGWVGMTAAADHGDDLSGLILLDSMVHRPDPEEEAHRVGAAFGPLRTYPSLEDALSHFRTVPDQPTSLPYVIDHVARGSLRRVEGGWSWKFDPRIFERRAVPPGDLLRRIRSRVALFRSEHGLVSRDIGQYMYEQLGRVAPIVEVPLAWHHVMLDQPIALVTGLRALLADWEHSTPHRRAG